MPSERPAIEDRGLTLSFVQTHPGKEIELARERLFPEGSSERPHVYKVLGKYDLLTIGTIADTDIPQPAFDPRIVHVANVVTFQWKVTGRNNTEEFLGRPILAVSFLKFDKTVLDEFGVGVEYRTAHQLYDTFHDRPISLQILGSLGWSEMVALISGSDINEVLNAAFEIRSWTDNGRSVFLSSVTVPCVNYRALIDEARILEEPAMVMTGSVEPTISVVCRPDREEQVAQLFREFFPSDSYHTRHNLGKIDITVSSSEARSAVFPSFILSLLRCRSELGSSDPSPVFSTNTTIGQSGGYPMPSGTLETSPGAPEMVYPDASGLRFIADGPPQFQSPSLHSMLARLFFLFNAHSRNPLLQDAFEDLAPFMRAVAELINDTAQDPERFKRALRSSLPKIMPTIIEAFNQRLSGSHEYLLTADDAFLTHPTGIQRILTAASAVPLSVKAIGGLPWDGFVTFGQPGLEWASGPFATLNLPMDSLLRPADWILLYHEVGHEFADSLGLLVDSRVRDVVEGGLALFGSQRAEDAYETIWEICSDLVSFEFGFQRDLGRYIQRVWGFLNRHLVNSSEAHKYFVRLCFVGCYASGKEAIAEQDREFLSSLVETLRPQVAAVFSDEASTRFAEAIDDVLGYADAYRVLIEILEPYRVQTSQHSQLVGGEVGEIAHLDIRDVPAYLSSLEPTESFGGNVASLLTLWDAARRHRASTRLSPSNSVPI